MPKQYHLADVLSVTTGILLPSPNREHPIDAMYDILGYMTGEDLFTHALPSAADAARPFLLQQFPALESEETAGMVSYLQTRLSSIDLSANPEEVKRVCDDWVSDFRFATGLPEYVDVEPIPESAWPGTDHAAILGDKPVMVVCVGEPPNDLGIEPEFRN